MLEELLELDELEELLDRDASLALLELDKLGEGLDETSGLDDDPEPPQPAVKTKKTANMKDDTRRNTPNLARYDANIMTP